MNDIAAADRADIEAHPLGPALLRLYEESAAAWDTAAETAGISPDSDERLAEREAAAAEARRDALGWWLTAIGSLVRGCPAATVREAIEQARGLAAAWGDDAPERRAMELLDAPLSGAVPIWPEIEAS